MLILGLDVQYPLKDFFFVFCFLFFCFSIFITLYLELVGGKTYRDNHQSLPQPTIDTYL